MCCAISKAGQVQTWASHLTFFFFNNMFYLFIIYILFIYLFVLKNLFLSALGLLC